MKLIAIDMDGTLLSKDNTISPANRDAIYEAQNQGNRIAICSGRSVLDIKEILLRDNIVASIIGGNGSTIYHREVLEQLTLSEELLQEIMELIESENMYYEIYTNDGIYVVDHKRKLLEEERDALLATSSDEFTPDFFERKIATQLNQHHLHAVPSFADIDFTSLSPYKIYAFSFMKEKRDRFQERIANRDDISITSGGAETVEISHRDASKAYGLKYLANHFNIPIENTVAIGDNYNDIPMFEVVGFSIAMENGVEEVKKAANYITKSHDEDGVAHAFEKFVLKSETSHRNK